MGAYVVQTENRTGVSVPTERDTAGVSAEDDVGDGQQHDRAGGIEERVAELEDVVLALAQDNLQLRARLRVLGFGLIAEDDSTAARYIAERCERTAASGMRSSLRIMSSTNSA